MTRILHPGNSRGFVLLDALLCLFITAVILLLLEGAGRLHQRVSTGAMNEARIIIEERNALDTSAEGNEIESIGVNQTFKFTGVDQNYETP